MIDKKYFNNANILEISDVVNKANIFDEKLDEKTDQFISLARTYNFFNVFESPDKIEKTRKLTEDACSLALDVNMNSQDLMLGIGRLYMGFLTDEGPVNHLGLPIDIKTNKIDGQKLYNEELQRRNLLRNTRDYAITLQNFGYKLIQQVALSLYDRYDEKQDQITGKVKSIKEAIKKDDSEIHSLLFEGDFATVGDALRPIRNVAGHSNLANIVNYSSREIPQIKFNGEEKDIFNFVSDSSNIYMNTGIELYKKLAKKFPNTFDEMLDNYK